ncbi:uncharacterized protein LACBIDRAFT_333374 [Laccaria bicolor S238N-H82]|uniref:Predicted protein n=1 Tax=Laccaria bicolor (strain S238N-H82 / ATCC MYA-4686) TaxID=486041 RepID=B0DVQ3_LACBS|nr:uncharacterized protein LACBIDRAFT_333374 [Laccaria bicolor S238N-H82]EDR01290.1 predicted protein [Laccaria bicolor S238N-H82]|eukprot:XP_001887997.1 predicted protein [Laccaria bicolor S238N-H82]
MVDNHVLHLEGANADGFVYGNPSRMGDVGGYRGCGQRHNSGYDAIVNEVDTIRHRVSTMAQGARYAEDATNAPGYRFSEPTYSRPSHLPTRIPPIQATRHEAVVEVPCKRCGQVDDGEPEGQEQRAASPRVCRKKDISKAFRHVFALKEGFKNSTTYQRDDDDWRTTRRREWTSTSKGGRRTYLFSLARVQILGTGDGGNNLFVSLEVHSIHLRKKYRLTHTDRYLHYAESLPFAKGAERLKKIQAK